MLSTHFPNEISKFLSITTRQVYAVRDFNAALRAKVLRAIVKIFCDCGKLKVFEKKNSDPYINGSSMLFRL